ncbi:MAG: biotin/lipoyl-binding protein [Firmicutes bacterium]|nr:biotin/lipoyl-binding protein [Bacillota bacterium]
MRRFRITVNGQSYEVEVEEIGGQFSAPVRPVGKVELAPAPAAPAPAPRPAAAEASRQAAARPSAPVQGNAVSAPLPGVVLDIKVTIGQEVKPGDVLFILEAMKMENEIMASQVGTVSEIRVGKGDSVNSGDVLLVLN